MRLGSRGTSEFLRSSGRPSQIRRRNALTEKAWEGAVQGLGNCSFNLTTNCAKYLQLKNQNVATFEIADHDSYERTSWSSDLIHFLLLTKVVKKQTFKVNHVKYKKTNESLITKLWGSTLKHKKNSDIL